MRKLASVQRIEEIASIPDAERVCRYRVLGWWVVDQIGKYNVGDVVIYCEPDSIIPADLQRDLFYSDKPEEEIPQLEGFVLKTKKIRKVYSQGMIIPIEFVDGHPVVVGDDVSEILGIVKHEPVVPAALAGNAKGNFPSFISRTDEPRCQNFSQKEYSVLKNKKYSVTEKLEGCFLRNQLVDLYDGGSTSFSKIIHGDRPYLVGVNENGEIVPTKVINVFKNGVKTKWVDVKFIPYKSMGVCGSHGRLRTTPNHKIFTSNMKEVNASDLKSGDDIFMWSNDYNDLGLHYIKSSLLGDGGIGANGHFSYNESHAVKHDEFNNYILDIFKNIKTSNRVLLSGKGSEIRHIKVFTSPSLRELRSEWYPNNKKKLPNDLSWFDDFTIAKWYMDDGSLSHNEKQNDRANFSSHAFCEEDVQRLCDKLHDMYGVSAVKYYSKGWTIRVNYDGGSIKRLWESIASYLHPIMRYKLPEEYREVPFKHYGYVNYIKKLIPVKVISVDDIEYTKKNFPSGSMAYDIGTETNNYFCGGVLVHNSSKTVFLKDDIFGVCSRNLELKDEPGNAYWQTARKLDIEGSLRREGFNDIALQGELIGPGVQGNIYKLKELDFRVFNVFLIDKGQYLSYNLMYKVCEAIGLRCVPQIYQEFKLPNSVDELLELAEGQSVLAPVEREGLVFRTDDRSISFKAISNKYLSKKD